LEDDAEYQQEWRVWLEKDGQPISFWHDVPLYPEKGNNRIVSYVVEIPRWTDGKIETKRSEPLSQSPQHTHSKLNR
jgi:inorganic pyrophosphatase